MALLASDPARNLSAQSNIPAHDPDRRSPQQPALQVSQVTLLWKGAAFTPALEMREELGILSYGTNFASPNILFAQQPPDPN